MFMFIMFRRFCLLTRHFRTTVKNPNGARLLSMLIPTTTTTLLGPHSSSYYYVSQFSGSGGRRLQKFSTNETIQGRKIMSVDFTRQTTPEFTRPPHNYILSHLAKALDVTNVTSSLRNEKDVYYPILGCGFRLIWGDLTSFSFNDKEEVKEAYAKLSTRIYLDIKDGNEEAFGNFVILQILFLYYYFGWKNNADYFCDKVYNLYFAHLWQLNDYCVNLRKRVSDNDIEEFRRSCDHGRKDLAAFFYKIHYIASGMPKETEAEYKISVLQEMIKWFFRMVEEGYYKLFLSQPDRAIVVEYLLNLCGLLTKYGKQDDVSILLGPFAEEDSSVKESTLFLCLYAKKHTKHFVFEDNCDH